jgi:hypothetical protein
MTALAPDLCRRRADSAATARSARSPNHTAAAPIKSYPRRPTTAGATVHSINHSDSLLFERLRDQRLWAYA